PQGLAVSVVCVPDAKDIVSMLRQRESPAGLGGIEPEIREIESPIRGRGAECLALDLLASADAIDGVVEEHYPRCQPRRRKVKVRGTDLRDAHLRRIEGRIGVGRAAGLIDVCLENSPTLGKHPSRYRVPDRSTVETVGIDDAENVRLVIG